MVDLLHISVIVNELRGKYCLFYAATASLLFGKHNFANEIMLSIEVDEIKERIKELKREFKRATGVAFTKSDYYRSKELANYKGGTDA